MRPPSKEEMAGLIESHVRDEVYYREALAMGLDQNDPSIRKRMRLKLEFLLEDLSAVEAPGDDELTAFLEERPERFQVATRVSFRQVYLNPAKRRDMDTEAKKIRARLHRGAAPETAGDTTMVPMEHRLATERDITRWFGEPFAKQVVALEPGAWHGPLFSGLGGHLVKVTERVEGRMPKLAEIRSQVEREYLAQRRQELKDVAYQRLRENYEVVIPSPSTLEGKPGEAMAQTRSAGDGAQ
jgi:hypothetical protein